MAGTGSVYLPNNYRLAFNCDQVVPRHVAQTKAQAYSERTGKSFYVPDLGHFSPAGGDIDPQPNKALKKK